MGISLRTARVEDAGVINEIYNHFVNTCTCTWQESPSTISEREAWMQQHDERYPVVVAVDDENGEVVGWGSLSPMSTRSGWRFTVEDSIYIHPAYQGRGIGRKMIAELIARAKKLGYRSIVGIISGDQPGSLGLHRAAGFEEVGRLKRAGEKFGRVLDAVYMQLSL